MEKFVEWLKPKSEEELIAQEESVNENLGEQIVRSSEKAILEMSLDEIKEKYPKRYEIYLKNLRAEKHGEKISESEKEKMVKWLKTLNNLDGYIEKHKSDEDEQTLREKQFTVFEDLRDSLEHGENSGYIKLPTGVGKTVLFSEFIEATGLKTLVVVPTKILIGQTEEKLKQFAPELEVAKYFSEEKKVKGDVQITTYISLLRQSQKEKGEIIPEDYDLLILDEAHKALSQKQAELIKGLKNQIKLGFTATPRYDEKKNLENLLGNEIHSMGVKEAIQEGLLSSCRVIIPKTEVDLTNIKITGGEYNQKELENAINIETRNKAAVLLYKQAFDGKSGIIFAAGVNHSNALKEMLKKEGISAEVIVAGTPKKERDEILKKYKDGSLKMLIGAQVFIEGFDEPRASICLNLAPTLSQVVAEQRAGRVLRLDPNNPNKEAYIIDFLDKNENKKQAQISFAEILGGAEIKNPNTQSDTKDYKLWQSNTDKLTGTFKQIKIEGLNVLVDPKEVMAIVKNISEAKYQELPDDWMAAGALEKIIPNSNRHTIQNRAERYREEYPEWFKTGRRNRLIIDAYSPELISKIKESYEPIPENWPTALSLRKNKILESNEKTIQSRAEKYREEHPEWFKRGVRTDHYSPELVEELKKELNIGFIKDGWSTAYKLVKIIGSADTTIIHAAEQYREIHPEWFEFVRVSSNSRAWAYSPELIAQLSKNLKVEKLPEDFLILQDLTYLGYPRKVKALINHYRISHPEWFKFGKKLRSPTEGYHPDLVAKIKEDIKKADLGEFRTASQVMKDLGRSDNNTLHAIKDIVERYRSDNPEWFRTGRSGAYSDIEGYHPNLIVKIKEDLKK